MSDVPETGDAPDRDPQDVAESLDEEVVDDVDDMSGDEYGEGLPDYPPDRPMGVDAFGVSAAEEDSHESLAERTAHGEPEFAEYPADVDRVGQLVEPNPSTDDDEEELLGEELPGEPTSAEESAVHIERET